MKRNHTNRGQSLDELTLREYAMGDAITHLREALALARRAGTPRTADRIRLALSSAKGAYANRGGQLRRAERIAATLGITKGGPCAK